MGEGALLLMKPLPPGYRLIATAKHLIAGPTIECIDLDEVRRAVRISATSEDTLVDTWISASREEFEEMVCRQLNTATWEYWLAETPAQATLELPRPPLQAVDSIVYDDENGDEQIFDAANYTVSAQRWSKCHPGTVTLINGASWPTVTCKPNAIRIRYQAGYGSARGDVPAVLRATLYTFVCDWFRYRSATHETAPGQSLQQPPFLAKHVIFEWSYSADFQLERPMIFGTSY